MKTRNRTIDEGREEKAKKVLKILDDKEALIRNVMKNPYVRIVLIGAAVYGIIFVSKYFINTSADAVTAVKKLRNAVRE